MYAYPYVADNRMAPLTATKYVALGRFYTTTTILKVANVNCFIAIPAAPRKVSPKPTLMQLWALFALPAGDPMAPALVTMTS